MSFTCYSSLLRAKWLINFEFNFEFNLEQKFTPYILDFGPTVEPSVFELADYLRCEVEVQAVKGKAQQSPVTI